MFNSIEELYEAVEERRAETVTLEVDLGSKYSPEYEAAKAELAQAKAMQTIMGGQGFLGDNLEALEAKVASLKPQPRTVWLRYSRLSLGEWGMLTKQANLTPVEQYEKVLLKTFVGLWGTDPEKPADWPEDEPWEEPAPLTTNAEVASTKGDKGVLNPGQQHLVIQTFMAWQNSSGDVSIRPTKSGRV